MYSEYKNCGFDRSCVGLDGPRCVWSVLIDGMNVCGDLYYNIYYYFIIYYIFIMFRIFIELFVVSFDIYCWMRICFFFYYY